MINPRTLLATIGATATAFALIIGSVVFDAAASAGLTTVETAKVSTRASAEPERFGPMGYVIASAPNAAELC